MLCDRQICPRSRYKGTGTIGQYKRQMKFAASMTPAKHIKRRSLKGMARPNDGYLIGIVVEMMSAVVGSLSSSLSPALIISGYAGWWPTGLPTRLSFS
ncbi:hypothetical protein ACVJGD_005386 [Bradyrhizobium sp. USDA 10063]